MPVKRTAGRVRAARILAIAADFVQIIVMPVFAEGFASPVNDALDVVVAIAMISLVGWHWAFLPAFVSELIPFWDLVPTWTAAVLIATRGAAAVEDAAGAGPPRAAAPKRLPAGEREAPATDHSGRGSSGS